MGERVKCLARTDEVAEGIAAVRGVLFGLALSAVVFWLPLAAVIVWLVVVS